MMCLSKTKALRAVAVAGDAMPFTGLVPIELGGAVCVQRPNWRDCHRGGAYSGGGEENNIEEARLLHKAQRELPLSRSIWQQAKPRSSTLAAFSPTSIQCE